MTRTRLVVMAKRVAEGTSFTAWLLEQLEALQLPAMLSAAISLAVALIALKYAITVLFPAVCILLQKYIELRIRALNWTHKGLEDLKQLPLYLTAISDWLMNGAAAILRGLASGVMGAAGGVAGWLHGLAGLLASEPGPTAVEDAAPAQDKALTAALEPGEGTAIIVPDPEKAPQRRNRRARRNPESPPGSDPAGPPQKGIEG